MPCAAVLRCVGRFKKVWLTCKCNEPVCESDVISAPSHGLLAPMVGPPRPALSYSRVNLEGEPSVAALGCAVQSTTSCRSLKHLSSVTRTSTPIIRFAVGTQACRHSLSRSNSSLSIPSIQEPLPPCDCGSRHEGQLVRQHK